MAESYDQIGPTLFSIARDVVAHVVAVNTGCLDRGHPFFALRLRNRSLSKHAFAFLNDFVATDMGFLLDPLSNHFTIHGNKADRLALVAVRGVVMQAFTHVEEETVESRLSWSVVVVIMRSGHLD